jgi:hypothetical protein
VGAGKDFERLTEQIFRILSSAPFEQGEVSVEHDVLLEGHEGPRQIDVLIRSKAGPIALTTIVECKDYARRVDVTVLDALHSVMQDVRANRAVIVARGGFTKNALQKARRLGIGAYTADHLGNVTDERLKVPVYVRDVQPTQIEFEGSIHLEAGDQVGATELLVVNGVSVLGLLRDDLIADADLFDAPAGRHEWWSAHLTEPMTIRTAAGDERQVKEYRLAYTLQERHFLGYLGDINEVLLLHDRLEDLAQVLIPAESFASGYEHFPQFHSRDELPVEPILCANVALIPGADDVKLHNASMHARRIGPG